MVVPSATAKYVGVPTGSAGSTLTNDYFFWTIDFEIDANHRRYGVVIERANESAVLDLCWLCATSYTWAVSVYNQLVFCRPHGQKRKCVCEATAPAAAAAVVAADDADDSEVLLALPSATSSDKDPTPEIMSIGALCRRCMPRLTLPQSIDALAILNTVLNDSTGSPHLPVPPIIAIIASYAFVGAKSYVVERYLQ